MNADLPQVITSSEMQSSITKRSAWFILVILLFFSLAAPINQFKVSPILPVLMEEFQLSIQQSGLLMSVFSLTGILLAIPAGFFLRKMGPRITGLVAGGAVMAGAVMGVLSRNVGGMLTSRVIEGIGTGFVAVLAPEVIAMWFSERRRGAAMGVWSTWIPIGSTIMMLLAPVLTHAIGWQSVWWVGALFALVATVLFMIYIKPPSSISAKEHSAVLPKASLVLRNPNIWLIGASFACFTMGAMSASTYTPTYLNTVGGLTLSQASLLLSLSSMLSILSCPLGGMLSDRIGARKPVFFAGFILMAIIMPLIGILDVKIVFIQFILQGLVVGLVPTNVMSAVVDTAGDERLSGLAMGIIITGQNLGMMIGPIIFGAVVEAGGWLTAYLCLAPMYLTGALLAWLARVK